MIASRCYSLPYTTAFYLQGRNQQANSFCAVWKFGYTLSDKDFCYLLNSKHVNNKNKAKKNTEYLTEGEEMEQFLKKKELQNDILKKIIEKINKEKPGSKKIIHHDKKLSGYEKNFTVYQCF